MHNHPLLKTLAPLARKLVRGKAPHGGDPAVVFNAVLEAGYLVVAADGVVDDNERHAYKDAVRALSEDMITGGEMETLMRDMAELRQRQGEEERCKQVGAMLREFHAVRPGLKLAAALAYVSGGLHEREMLTLRKLAHASGLTPEELSVLTMEMRPPEDL